MPLTEEEISQLKERGVFMFPENDPPVVDPNKAYIVISADETPTMLIREPNEDRQVTANHFLALAAFLTLLNSGELVKTLFLGLTIDPSGVCKILEEHLEERNLQRFDQAEDIEA